jgi:hypothetical protein
VCSYDDHLATQLLSISGNSTLFEHVRLSSRQRNSGINKHCHLQSERVLLAAILVLAAARI